MNKHVSGYNYSLRTNKILVKGHLDSTWLLGLIWDWWYLQNGPSFLFRAHTKKNTHCWADRTTAITRKHHKINPSTIIGSKYNFLPHKIFNQSVTKLLKDTIYCTGAITIKAHCQEVLRTQLPLTKILMWRGCLLWLRPTCTWISAVFQERTLLPHCDVLDGCWKTPQCPLIWFLPGVSYVCGNIVGPCIILGSSDTSWIITHIPGQIILTDLLLFRQHTYRSSSVKMAGLDIISAGSLLIPLSLLMLKAQCL
jgi:hypothetical protein